MVHPAPAPDSGAVESTGAAYKVFVVEDAASIRARLIELIDEIDDVAVVGEAESPAEAVAGIFRTRPHCVVLDFRLTGGTCVDVLRAVHPGSPEIGFVVLTNHPTSQYRRACMEAGATAFLDKSTELGKLKDVVVDCLFAQADGTTAGHVS
jgi:DNA-binding NarL/FixJ family response regulator